MPINNDIRNYHNALEIVKSNSDAILEVNKDGSIRTQNALDKLVLLGSRFVGNYKQVKKEKDAAVATALQSLWSKAAAAKAGGAKGDVEALINPKTHRAAIYVKRFIDAKTEIDSSVRGILKERAKFAKVSKGKSERPSKAVQTQTAASLGQSQSLKAQLQSAQLKAIGQISQALTDFATNDTASSDRGVSALQASIKLDQAVKFLSRGSGPRTVNWGNDVIKTLQQNGFRLGDEPLKQFSGLRGADDNASKILDWAKQQPSTNLA